MEQNKSKFVRKCPICGEGKLVKNITEEVIKYKDKTVVVPNFVSYECDKCGEAIISRETLKLLSKRLGKLKEETKISDYPTIKFEDYNLEELIDLHKHMLEIVKSIEEEIQKRR